MYFKPLRMKEYNAHLIIWVKCFWGIAKCTVYFEESTNLPLVIFRNDDWRTCLVGASTVLWARYCSLHTYFYVLHRRDWYGCVFHQVSWERQRTGGISSYVSYYSDKLLLPNVEYRYLTLSKLKNLGLKW